MTTFLSEEDSLEGYYDEETLNVVGSDVLAKACVDDCFDYALKLRTGDVIRFTGAWVVSPDWVHLKLYPPNEQPLKDRLPFRADRGIDVRIADIVWVMDAPEGS